MPCQTGGSRSRRREWWGEEAGGGLREAGVGDRPGRLDGEDDLQANLRVMEPVRSRMNS